MSDVCTVLVVDDDFMVNRIHTEFVGSVDGFQVVASSATGADALEAVAQHVPDLVLLDIYLPDMTGIEVLRRIRQEAPGVDVLIVTAARELETVREAMRGGAVSYLIKPFEYDDLRQRLEQYRLTRHLLEAAEDADQSQVDRIFGGTAPAVSESLPKGLSRPTADAVLEVVDPVETISAAECAEKVGISRVSARRYLEYFEHEGVLEVRLRYGRAGRPERRYRKR